LDVRGWCWWHRGFAPGDTVLEGLDNKVREGQKSLCTDPQPLPHASPRVTYIPFSQKENLGVSAYAASLIIPENGTMTPSRCGVK
jgi:hypothetical protein